MIITLYPTLLNYNTPEHTINITFSSIIVVALSAILSNYISSRAYYLELLYFLNHHPAPNLVNSDLIYYIHLSHPFYEIQFLTTLLDLDQGCSGAHRLNFRGENINKFSETFYHDGDGIVTGFDQSD